MLRHRTSPRSLSIELPPDVSIVCKTPMAHDVADLPCSDWLVQLRQQYPLVEVEVEVCWAQGQPKGSPPPPSAPV